MGKNHSDSHKANNSEILHELLQLPSKYAHFVRGDRVYLGTRYHASLDQGVPTLFLQNTGLFLCCRLSADFLDGTQSSA